MLDKHLSYNIKNIVNNIKSKNVLLAISGGLDSTFLMHVLLLHGIKPNLFFVNYNSTSNSNKRKKFIESLSKKYKLKFTSIDIDLTSSNFESKARAIRYKLLNEYADKNNIKLILTAHHKDDQLETLYMKYEDKADWISFLGIRFQYNKVLRPMLHIEKKEISDFVKEFKIKWIEDSTNEDLSIRRNNIRLKVLPMIRKNNPILIEELYSKLETSNKKMKLFNNSLASYTKDYLKCSHNDYFIIMNKFIESNDIICFKLFYQHLFNKYMNLQVQCSGKHWQAFFDFIKSASVGSVFALDKFISIIRDREFHYIYKNQFLENRTKEVDNEINDWYNTKFIINDKNNKSYNYIESVNLSQSIFKSGIKIRNWINGDKFYNNDSDSYKSLKKIFLNKKISVFDKAIYPIILDSNDQIIYIPKIYQRYNFEFENESLVTLSWVN